MDHKFQAVDYRNATYYGGINRSARQGNGILITDDSYILMGALSSIQPIGTTISSMGLIFICLMETSSSERAGEGNSRSSTSSSPLLSRYSLTTGTILSTKNASSRMQMASDSSISITEGKWVRVRSYHSPSLRTLFGENLESNAWTYLPTYRSFYQSKRSTTQLESDRLR